MTLSRLLRISRHRVRSLFNKDKVDAELGEELTFHFDQLVDELRADGLSPNEAKRAARRTLGNVTLLEDEARDHRRVTWLHDAWQDVLFGLRMLRKSPLFTAVATLSLAIGIGANTAVLGVMTDVLGGGLWFPDADRLVVIRTIPLDAPQRNTGASVPEYLAWKTRSRAFDVVGASIGEQKDLGAETDRFAAERLGGQGVAPAVFQALGVQPILGRVFTEAEAEVDHPAPVIVISHRVWQRLFGADAAVINRTVRLGDVDTAIIGVMPPEFRYPTDNTDYWAPLPLTSLQLQGSARLYLVTARLKPGVTIQQAQSDVGGISRQLAEESPQRQGFSARVVPLKGWLLGWTWQPLLTFEAAVFMVLLIACANVAGLMLARGSARRSEIAIRMALGAGHGRIVRQLLTESVLLSVLGGAFGVLVAFWGVRALVAMAPPIGGIRMREVELNLTMLLTTAALSLASGLLFGLAPTVAAFKVNLTASLNESVRGTGTQAGGQRLRGALVAAQIAVALTLLTGTGLLANSVLRMAGRELNVDPRGVLSFDVRFPMDGYNASAGMFHGVPYGAARPPVLTVERLYDRLRGIPGVESVAGISSPPINSLLVPAHVLHLDGTPLPSTDAERARFSVRYFIVTPAVFKTLRATLVRGREFDDRDRLGGPWTAVINQTAAHRYWPGQDAVGKRFTLDVVSGEQPREVIGVVRDIPLRAGFFDDDAVVYTSFLQQPQEYRGPAAAIYGQVTFLLRTAGDPLAFAPAVQRAVAEIEPDRALGRLMPLEWYIAGGWRGRGTSAVVLGAFGVTAILLAAIGIYGVLAYAVVQRTREIGVRLALGATPDKVIALLGRTALILVAAGLVVGLAASLAFARLIRSQLWGITPTDPATYATVSLLVVVVALVACFVPLRRALQVDPTVALRYE